ncbi:MAG: hypothetical protein IPG87_12130 [Saprospiraceae bacterium]|nr:hypothetical protein [Candidatus Vicinibacter affinis]
MKKCLYPLLLAMSLSFVHYSCNKTDQKQDGAASDASSGRFNKIESEESGIDFSNNLKEDVNFSF